MSEKTELRERLFRIDKKAFLGSRFPPGSQRCTVKLFARKLDALFPPNPSEKLMRTSQFLIATQKETPADAEVISHQLMLRAGLIRKLAAGLYTWLPLGLRVLRNVEGIVRQEMDKSGAQ